MGNSTHLFCRKVSLITDSHCKSLGVGKNGICLHTIPQSNTILTIICGLVTTECNLKRCRRPMFNSALNPKVKEGTNNS